MQDSTQQLIERISAWARDHPEASNYCLGDELEARQLLLVIAATMKETTRGCSDLTSDEKRTLKRIRTDMCRAAAQGMAMDYIRALNKTDQLEFLGLEIHTPAIVLQ